jgi:hypothetical protein
VSSSIMARERPGIVLSPPRRNPAGEMDTSGKKFSGRETAQVRRMPAARAGQDAPGGGAQDGSRFSRNAAIPSAASAEPNSARETSVARVNAASRSIPGIV